MNVTGVLMTPTISSRIQGLIASLNVSVTYIHPQHCVLAANLTASLLATLNWTDVAYVFSQSQLFGESFAEAAIRETICMKRQVPLDNK